MNEKDIKCPYCNELQKGWSDEFEGVVHYKEFSPQYEYDKRFYHKGTHIYITNDRAILDVESFQYLIRYCPYCGKELVKKDLKR